MPTPGFFVKDIIIIGNQYGLNGEHRESMRCIRGHQQIVINQGITDHTRVHRIVKQILSIATYTKTHASPERLTRAITDEFSFYTRSTPLSIEEYRSIINQIANELRSFPPNIIIIASSMPVLWTDGGIRNAVLHIQTPNHAGATVKIHHFSKKHLAPNDPLYEAYHTIPYPQQADDDASAQYSPNIVLADTAACLNDTNQHHSAIVVEGANLPSMIHAIDICLDHANGVAIENATQLLQSRPFPPLYISHIISSQTIHVIPKRSAAAASHADASHGKVLGVPKEKEESIYTVFGQDSIALVYQPKRVELLHSKLFDIATRNLSQQELTQLKDPHHNTLLHQILLKEKKASATCVHFRRRLNKLIPRFRGRDINQQNLDGDTPLHLAVESITDKNTLTRFLEQGARLDIKNNAGFSPISLAYQHPDPAVLTSLITKLINSGPVYLAHRHTILDIVVELKEPWQNTVLIAAVQFELSHSQPNMRILIELLERLAPRSVLNLSLTPFATRHGEAELERLLRVDPHFATLEPNEKEIIIAYFMQSSARLLPFKGELDTQGPLIKKLITLFTKENAHRFTWWIKQRISQSEQQTKVVSLLQQDITHSSALLNIASRIHHATLLCELPDGLNIAEYLLAKLYLLQQIEVPISPPIIERLFIKIGPTLHQPSPQHHLDAIMRSGIISSDDPTIQSWFYNTFIRYELSVNFPRLDFILSIPDSIIEWREPGGLYEELTLAETLIACICLSPIPSPLFHSLLNLVLPKTPCTLFDILSKIATIISNKADMPITLRQLYQQVLLHESQAAREINIPLIIELLKQNIDLTISTENELTLAEQLFAQIYVLTTSEHLPKDTLFFMLDTLALYLSIPVKNSVRKIADSISKTHGETPLSDNIQHDLYGFLLDYALSHLTPGMIHFKIIATSISKMIDLRVQCGLSNALTLAEQAIATLYKIECHHTIDPTQKYETLHILLKALPHPIEKAIARIAFSFSLLPNSETKHSPTSGGQQRSMTYVMPYEVNIWLYQALFTDELTHYEPTSQKQSLKFLPLASQQQSVPGLTFHTENPAEQAIMHAAKLKDDHLFHQAYHELEKANQPIDIDRICCRLSAEEQTIRADWIRRALFRVDTQRSISFEFTKAEGASLQKLLNAIGSINLREDCGLNNGLTLAEQFMAQAVIFSLTPSVVRSTDDIDLAERLLSSTVAFIATPFHKSIQRIVASFLTSPNHKLTAPPAVITHYIYATLIKRMLTEPFISLQLLIDTLSPPSSDYCLHHMPGMDPNLTMAEEVIKSAVLLKNERLLEVALLHHRQANQPIDIPKILAACPSAPHTNPWLETCMSDFQSKWQVLDELKKEKHADINLIMGLIHKITAHVSAEFNNGLTILEQSVAQAYISDSPELLLTLVECAPWSTVENIVTKVAKSLVDAHLDIAQNECIHNQFKTFCYTTLLSFELSNSPPDTVFVCHLLSEPHLSFQKKKPDGSLLFLTEILSTTAQVQSAAVLSLFYTNILPQTNPRHLTDAIQSIQPVTHQRWFIDHLMRLANHKNPVDTSTVTLLSTFNPPPSPSQQFFKSHPSDKPDDRAARPK